MKFINHSHFESLSCHIKEMCIWSGQPLTGDQIADIVIRYENEESVSFSSQEVLKAQREGAEGFVSSMQQNAIDTPISEDFTAEDQDMQIAFWEAMRPSSVRRKILLSEVAAGNVITTLTTNNVQPLISHDDAEAIIVALIANNVQPVASHVAAPGEDSGFVAVYLADDDGRYAIQYGDNGTTNYCITEDIDDLACWLLGDDADAVEVANARDEDPDVVDADYAGAVYIIAKGDFFGYSSYSWITAEDVNQSEGCEIHEFDSVAEAQEWIDEVEDEIYQLAHNEAGRPDYFIVAV